eukprot:s505_g25.t3
MGVPCDSKKFWAPSPSRRSCACKAVPDGHIEGQLLGVTIALSSFSCQPPPTAGALFAAAMLLRFQKLCLWRHMDAGVAEYFWAHHLLDVLAGGLMGVFVAKGVLHYGLHHSNRGVVFLLALLATQRRTRIFDQKDVAARRSDFTPPLFGEDAVSPVPPQLAGDAWEQRTSPDPSLRVGLLFHEGEGKGCGKGYGQPYEYGYGKGGKSFPAPAKGKGKGIQAEAAKGKGKGGKSKGVSSHGEAKGGKKGQRRPTTAQAWLEAISVEADPDRKVEMMASSALVLAAGLQELPLASLRTLTDTINDCQGGLIPQRLDTALQQLAPALVPCLMRKLAPQLSAERLDVMLKVLQRTLQAEPTMGAVLQNRNNMSPVQAAVQQNGSLFTRQLWEQLQAIADQGANAPLRSVVHSRAREQARTANARDLPDPFEVDILPTFEELLRTDGRLPTNRDRLALENKRSATATIPTTPTIVQMMKKWFEREDDDGYDDDDDDGDADGDGDSYGDGGTASAARDAGVVGADGAAGAGAGDDAAGGVDVKSNDDTGGDFG